MAIPVEKDKLKDQKHSWKNYFGKFKVEKEPANRMEKQSKRLEWGNSRYKLPLKRLSQ
ncbi:hypothetical protein HYE08_01515 [Mycoplasmopsis bovis]|nr:hypothetical protein [Mycoplasmopsis bovis]QQH27052.1 hypothetical protein HYE08_01515 [Mycoplasmopsis bovis]